MFVMFMPHYTRQCPFCLLTVQRLEQLIDAVTQKHISIRRPHTYCHWHQQKAPDTRKQQNVALQSRTEKLKCCSEYSVIK